MNQEPASLDYFSAGYEVFEWDGPILMTVNECEQLLQQHGQTFEAYQEDHAPIGNYEHGTAKHVMAWLGY